MPWARIAWLNFSRSSASSIERSRAPMSWTLYRSSAPRWESARAMFSPVCPPTVGSIASGRSWAMIASSASGVSGST
jgi:hypothetical protein